ncbi:Enoyl-CoA hydratase/isomerase [Parafrankia sp. EAN1pec]|uniref:enoyl-CoA hydratase-related protein n=1 Tax=Parafrankia sp. (strain EAN1pec) TaxID=298653 RepID=UPI0000544E8D|nr:Enoyl-CoA hydratase/isomerase [Frankia sp. EAN1pec]
MSALPSPRVDDEVVRYEVDNGVAVLTLNRPDRMNAWTLEMEDRYFDLLLEADADPEVRAVVVTGAGKAFSPGADADELGAGAAVGALEFGQLHRRSSTLPLTVGKPVIGAINGAVAGISLVQVLQMDVRFIAAEAKLTFAFPRRGLVAESCAAWLLPRLIGTARALDLLLSGRTVLADEALELGLANWVVPRDGVLEAALGYAHDLVKHCSPRSMAIIKQQVFRAWEIDLETARIEVAASMAAAFASDDFKEGVRSFVDRRPPAFAGLTTEGRRG